MRDLWILVVVPLGIVLLGLLGWGVLGLVRLKAKLHSKTHEVFNRAAQSRSWVGCVIAPVMGGIAGVGIAQKERYPQLPSFVIGALLGLLAGAIVWILDRCRKPTP